MGGADVEELIMEADTDKNGSIDYDEFLAYFHSNEDIPDDKSSEPGSSGETSKKHQHTEKLGVLLDRLIIEANSQEELDQGSPAASPGSRTPKPLLSRNARKAKTAY